MLYEVALVKKPTSNEEDEGKQEELILAPTAVIASDDRAAGIKAVMDNKEKITSDLARVTVLVRPFV